MGKRNLIPAPSRIVQAAVELFNSNGFEQTTFAQIAKKAGLSQPAIYVYYNNKMDLLAAACEASAAEGRRFIDGRVDPRKKAIKRLEMYIDANLEFFYHERAYAQSLMAAYYFASSSTKIRQILTVIESSTKARLEVALIHCRNEGENISVSPDLINSVHSVLVGDCYKAIYLTKPDTLPKLKARSFKSICRLVG